jgi:diaminohydroxyphosphoribosylaminopyrimidine deaminase/5-amino-6-(5-phosphoribosylamino)uracil reductase
MTRLTPKEAMLMAVEEGRKGAGHVSPNPLVGCVILDHEYHLLAKGYHARLGDLHAETAALAQVTDPTRLEGAHVFVTLEPCAHDGRQPACAKTLAALPIASVTYGVRDPNPLVSGQGEAILQAAGKQVILFGELRDELEELAEIFLLNMREGRPFVAVKVASSLDGRIALRDGSSRWITGPAARERVHYLRGCYDAVLTGAGTLLKDNPRLDARDPRFAGRARRLVVLDPQGRAAAAWPGSKAAEARPPEDVFWLTGKGMRAPEGTHHLELSLSKDGVFDIDEMLARLRAEGMHSVFVEAGARTVGGFLRAKRVDRLYLFLAPKLLGEGLGWTSGFEIASLPQAVSLASSRWSAVGGDFLISARPVFT